MGVALKYIPKIPIYAQNLNVPFFRGEEQAVVLDVDGVLLRQTPNFYNDQRGSDSYHVYDGATNFLCRLQKKFGESNVVLWSACPNYIDFFGGTLFRNIQHHIAGLSEMDLGGLPVYCKDLQKINLNLSNLIAVEDAASESECCFFPTGRVVRVLPNRARQDYDYLFHRVMERF